MTLSADEFIRRFLLHVLPKGFHRIRHYGLLASAGCKTNIARARQLMAAPMAEVDPPAVHDTADPNATTDHRPPCPCCGGRMIIVEVFARGRAPRGPRPPAPRSRPDPMTFIPVPSQHPFAGTSRSRRRVHFIPAPSNVGRTSPTSRQSGRRVRQQRSVPHHQRLSALSDPAKTIP
jgi:hypothetical protein